MELTELKRKIIEASQVYYEENKEPIVPDQVFDDWIAELRSISPNDPILTTIGYGYQIDLDNNGEKFEHEYKLVGSLDKITIENWRTNKIIQNTNVKVLSSKLDGLSIVCYYKKGLLFRALTRGGNNIGIDATSKLIYLVPRTLLEPIDMAVRGEIVIPLEIFKEFYPNASDARTTAGGILRSLNPTFEEINRLVFKTYTAYNNHEEYFKTKLEMLEWLINNKFTTIEYQGVDNYEFINMSNDSLEKLKGIFDDKVLSDGLVITDNSNPYSSIAYKFIPECAEVPVTQVIYGLSRLGNMIPVVYYQPVKLSGAMLEKANGANAKYIVDKSIGVGSRIIIQRSGEVIPYIKNVVSPGVVILPTECPVCKTLLAWEGVHLTCINQNCPAKSTGSLYVWYWTIAPVHGLSNSVLDVFFPAMSWDSIEDIYKSSEDQWNLVISKNFQANSHDENLLNRWRARLGESVDPNLFIAGFGLKSVGVETSIRINEDIGLENYFNGNTDFTKVSRITTPAIEALVNNYDYMKRVYNLVKLKVGFKNNNIKIKTKYSVVITGKLSKSRNLLSEEFLNHGIEVTDNLKNSKYLITDDTSTGSNKLKIATKLGITIISEAEFRKLMIN